MISSSSIDSLFLAFLTWGIIIVMFAIGIILDKKEKEKLKNDKP